MEEQEKTVVVEKRVSRGVIRRRSRTAPKLAEAKGGEQPQEKKEKVLKLKRKEEPKEVIAPKEKIKAKEDTKTQKVVKKAKKASTKKESTETAVASKANRFVLSEDERKKAEANVKKHVQAVVHKEEVVEKTDEVALPAEGTVTAEGTVKVLEDKKKTEKKEKEEERPKVLSFKDRIRGHIDLKKTKPAVKKEEKEDGDDSKQKDNLRKTKEDVEKTEKQKKLAKTKKGVKNIGGDLDIDGHGRAQTLAQLSRTSPVDRVYRPGEMGRRKKKVVSRKNVKQTVITTKKASKRYVEIDQVITVGNLAQELGVKAGEIIKKLMELGTMATINQEIDKDTATLIATDYEYEVRDVSFKENEILSVEEPEEEDNKDYPGRPPVVTIMGHVDHGKTSLLDKIRSTNVVSGEAGGITQHIGAYTVSLDQGKITFLDTPGHEAFTTMRLRGAKATDIVVLVVAADDGVMPQTMESIEHARIAGVPIIVAVNKIDKPEADPDRVKRQLSEKGLVSEEWGGDVIFNHVSAKQGTGINELLENVLLQAEMLELKARKDGRAKGIVLEARLDRGRGPVCTLLVQEGTLTPGEAVVAGYYSGRVRSMIDWTGEKIIEATPSTAVEILGLEGVPDAGEPFYAAPTEKDAKSIVENRMIEKQRKTQEAQSQVTLEDMFSKMQAGELSELSVILKTDVHGSLEAVREAILKIGNEEVQAKIIHSGVGGVNESDVQLAMASKAIIIGFNVRPETKALHMAKDNHVDIKLYKVIYDLVNEVKLAMQGLLAPDVKETYLGRAEVRQAFEVSKVGTIAGCMVTDGKITRTANLRLLRDNVVIFEGKVASLKRFKDDAKEVKQNFECGIGVEGYGDIKSGDVIEVFEITEIQKTL